MKPINPEPMLVGIEQGVSVVVIAVKWYNLSDELSGLGKSK
jgi:hypothetical protein